MTDSTKNDCLECGAFLMPGELKQYGREICSDCYHAETRNALADLKNLPGLFKVITDIAKREADETRAWSERINSTRLENELNLLLDECDYLFQRGKYRKLRRPVMLREQAE